MDVIADKKAYAPGETMVIVAKINNSSSRGMTPKFRLVQEVVYHANGNFRRQCNVIHRLVDQHIESRTHKDARCTIWIPDDLLPTIQNCNIISVTYHLKLHPSPPPPPFHVSPTAPTYNPLPSAPMMNTDFLSQSDEAPPAYLLLFPSSAPDEPDAK
ncbi:hypothetical protein ABVT39_003126 [Epinephelus coioides]